jgi:hypothetical protein
LEEQPAFFSPLQHWWQLSFVRKLILSLSSMTRRICAEVFLEGLYNGNISSRDLPVDFFP